jgi:hypothetical protein
VNSGGLVKEEIFQLRECKTVQYEQFVLYLVPAVTGSRWKRTKKSNIMAKQSFQKSATVSDEAFALLVMENAWDVWKDEAEKIAQGKLVMPGPSDRFPSLPKRSVVYGEEEEGATPAEQGTENQAGDPPSTEKPSFKYTKTDLEKGKEGKGWSNEGMKRYNDLLAQVAEDRKKHPEWDDKLLEWIVNNERPNAARNVGEIQGEAPVAPKLCLAELFDDTNGLSSDMLSPMRK